MQIEKKMIEFLKTAVSDVDGRELWETVRMLDELWYQKELRKYYGFPSAGTALAFAVGVRYGMGTAKIKRKRLSIVDVQAEMQGIST